MNARNTKRFIPCRLINSVLAAMLLSALALGDAQAATASGYSKYFIPGGEYDVRTVFEDLDQIRTATGITTIGVSASTADTTLYYDHWENGYTYDPANPSTTADEVVRLRATTITTPCTETNNAVDTPVCQTAQSYYVFDSTDIPATAGMGLEILLPAAVARRSATTATTAETSSMSPAAT